jgi:DnaJ-domain-containing protein 1
MTDYFALLDEPRRPWLDPEALKAKFHQRSAELHPDRVHGESAAEKAQAQDRYTELNAAYTSLRQPKDRLLHLLTLELGAKPKDVQNIPPELMELFFEVGKVCLEVDQFLAEKARANSPLLRVQLFEHGEEWRERLNALADRLKAKLAELEEQTKALNPAWGAGGTLPLERLEAIYRLTSYYSRWLGQLQERAVQLAF